MSIVVDKTLKELFNSINMKVIKRHPLDTNVGLWRENLKLNIQQTMEKLEVDPDQNNDGVVTPSELVTYLGETRHEVGDTPLEKLQSL